MTDEEIIKALECCYTVGTPCRECPFDDTEHCNDELMGQYILDLINRQRAEIKQKDTEIDILIRKNETLKDEVLELREEIERLQDIDKRLGEDVDLKLDYIYTLESQLKTVKSETIKEVTAKLRKYVKFDINNDVYIKGADVDKVLNEME